MVYEDASVPVGQRFVRNLLEERNTTQKQLAIDLNIAPSTIGGYVQNSSEPDFETLKRFAKHFEVSTDYLLDYRTSNTATRMEDELVRVFRSMTLEQQEMYVEQGKAVVRLNHNRKEKAKSS